LECSGRGDKRFSAFYARIKKRNNFTIEAIYQQAKVIEGRSGWDVREVKGRRAENQEEVTKLYAQLWDEYMLENPQLLGVLVSASGLSDMFGQEGHVCQATELWRIRCRHKAFLEAK
jgi:hypothetical protein